MSSNANNSQQLDVLNSLHDLISSISCKPDLEEIEAEYLRYIAPLIPAHASALYLFKPNQIKPIRIAATGVDEEFLSYYEEAGRNLDPLRAWITTNYSAYQSQLLLGLEGWQHHPVYRVVGPACIDYAMQSPLIVGQDIIGTLNFGREVAEGQFTRIELQVVSILSKFLSLAIVNSFGGLSAFQRREQFCQAMDAAQQGIVVTDSEHTVQYANEAAHGLVTRVLGAENTTEPISQLIREGCKNNVKSGIVKSDTLVARFCPVPGSQSNQTVALLDENPSMAQISILRCYLTSREIDVVRLVEQGLHNRDIADKLYISVNTVKRHLDNIYDKLGVGSRIELVSKVYRLIN
ncbi:MAG: LuxR C-terminal-related transcriptional regulator [Syntrophomonas sp.]